MQKLRVRWAKRNKKREYVSYSYIYILSVRMNTLSASPVKYILLNIFIATIFGIFITAFSIKHDAEFIKIQCVNTTTVNNCCVRNNNVVECYYTTTPIVAIFILILAILIYILILLIKVCPPPDKK
jgi:ABC-type Fe3+-siderophore transport system permease subunit